ncbi:hypothetical protein [Paenibacillus dauci]|uniref:hypothetical protein n=1 Tax=Paenibacillus dauci TaxID=1567106 RepID=UPI000619E116|nr:hypothetical protein [Paenibacillus dauci]
MKKKIIASVMSLALLLPATSGFAAADWYWTNSVTRLVASNQACGTIVHDDGRGYIGTLTSYQYSTYGNERQCWYQGRMEYRY